MNLRRTLLPWHRRIGLAAALLIVVQALSGSLLVFRQELGRAIDPAGMQRHTPAGPADAPLASVLHSLQAAFPAHRLQRLVYPDTQQATYFAHLRHAASGEPHYATIDPGDGAVLREGGIWRFPAEAILELHYRLMGGTAGQCVVALTGVLLLAMLLTGLVHAWPRPGQWRTSLRIETRSPRFLRQLHRSTGVLAAPVLALSILTGLAMALELALEALQAAVAAPAAAAARAVPAAAPPEAIAHAERIARAEFPHNALRDLRLPDAATARFLFRAPERNASAVHEARIDLRDRSVVARMPAVQDRSLWSLLLPWHTGRALGWPGRLLVVTSGLALAALALIGPWMWWRTRTARHPGRASAPAPRASPM